MDERIQELLDEVERYKKALSNAEAALDDAEKELDEELSMRFENRKCQE